MHRFTTQETKSIDRKSKAKLLYLVCPLLIVAFYLMISSVDKSTTAHQQESLENAINRNILHCYAVEGFYPPSLKYMEEHYGLSYDHDLFKVDYQPIASNIRPDVTILVMSETKE